MHMEILSRFRSLLLPLTVSASCVASAAATQWNHSYPFRWDYLTGILFANGRFFVVRNFDFGFSSEDGMTWTSHSDRKWETAPVTPQRLLVLNGQMMGFEGRSIYRSPDGISWSKEAAPLQSGFSDLTFGKGMFVGVGGDDSGKAVLTSADGTQWTKHRYDLSGYYSRVVSGNGVFVMIDNARVATSSNGTDWTLAKSVKNATEADGLKDIAFGNGTFAAVGDKGVVVTSSDGTTWAESTLTEAPNLLEILFAENQFTAITSAGAAFTSPDGRSWTAHATNVVGATHFAFGNGRYVTANGKGEVAVSTDKAVTWTSMPHRPGILFSAIYNGTTFAAVGQIGAVTTSTDAERWTERNSGTSQTLNGIAWGKNTAVAVGDSGTVLTSPDLIHWTRRDAGTTDKINAVLFVDSIFLATVSSPVGGSILASSNGIAWAPVYASADDRKIESIGYGGGTFLALSSAQLGTLLTSKDGFHWTRKQFAKPSNFFESFVTYGRSGFLFGVDDNDDTLYLSKTGETLEPVWVQSGDDIYGEPYNVLSAAYGQGYYVGVKNNTRNMVYSYDGRFWNKDSSDRLKGSYINYLGGKWLKFCNDQGVSVAASMDVLPTRPAPARSAALPRALRLPPEGFDVPASLKGSTIAWEILDARGKSIAKKIAFVKDLPFRIAPPSARGTYFIRMSKRND